jgi:hypothetical protein
MEQYLFMVPCKMRAIGFGNIMAGFLFWDAKQPSTENKEMAGPWPLPLVAVV